MRVYLMRHGDALPLSGEMHEDGQRPLSAKGQAQVRQVAEGFKRKISGIDLLVSSPLVRARETAQIMADVLGGLEPEVSPALAPSASAAGVRTLISESRVSGILLVGHHPDVTLWTAFLTHLDASVCPLFSTASILALEFDPTKKAQFLWFHTPEQLAQL